MAVKLGIKSRAEAGDALREVSLSNEEILLGRDKVCDVVLAEVVVSRRHARIVREGELYLIEDTASAYGTRINGQVLPSGEKRLLGEGDVIAIGPYDVEVHYILDASLQNSKDMNNSHTKVIVKKIFADLPKEHYFLVMNGASEGLKFEIREAQELIIGRDLGVEIRLDDEMASRRHAKLRRDWSGTYLEDLQSRNGVRVNGKVVPSCALLCKDEIEIGSTRFLFIDPLQVSDAPAVSEHGESSSEFPLSGVEDLADNREVAPDNDSDSSKSSEPSVEPGPLVESDPMGSPQDQVHDPSLGKGSSEPIPDAVDSGASSSTPIKRGWKYILVCALLGAIMLVSLAVLIASFFAG